VEEFREKDLDDRERRIFLALLREEYSGGEGTLRDLNPSSSLYLDSMIDRIEPYWMRTQNYW